MPPHLIFPEKGMVIRSLVPLQSASCSQMESKTVTVDSWRVDRSSVRCTTIDCCMSL